MIRLPVHLLLVALSVASAGICAASPAAVQPASSCEQTAVNAARLFFLNQGHEGTYPGPEAVKLEEFAKDSRYRVTLDNGGMVIVDVQMGSYFCVATQVMEE